MNARWNYTEKNVIITKIENSMSILQKKSANYYKFLLTYYDNSLILENFENNFLKSWGNFENY